MSDRSFVNVERYNQREDGSWHMMAYASDINAVRLAAVPNVLSCGPFSEEVAAEFVVIINSLLDYAQVLIPQH
jgi:hypothetical protein